MQQHEFICLSAARQECCGVNAAARVVGVIAAGRECGILNLAA